MLTELGVDDVGLLITVGVVVGIAAPLLLWWLAQRLPLRWLFNRPRVLGKTS